MKKLFWMLVFVIAGHIAKAQSNAVEAKAAYMLAEENYDKENYPLALSYLKKTQKSLGFSNCKILYLQIQIEKEISKKQNNYRDSLIKTISAFQGSPDIKDFNEDKVLEVIKMKMELEQVVDKEKLIITEKKLADSIRKVTDSIEKVKNLSQLFFVDGWELGQLLESAQKKSLLIFLKQRQKQVKISLN